MFQKIQVRRGLRSELPILGAGEIGFCTDTKEVFIGDGAINIAFANKAQDPWLTPALLNAWVNFGSGLATCQYMKDSMGFVHLKGLVKNGVIGTVLFTLPVGYRPAETQHFGTASDNAYGQTVIYNTGDIFLDRGTNVWVTISGVTFKAEL